MAGELERALSSIDFSLNNKETKYNELAMLGAQEKYFEDRNKKEMESQLAYSQFEEQITQFSQNLLEHDRNAIRGFIGQNKEYLRKKIQENGGSYSKFMKNGGIRHLSDYKSSILNSKQALRYKANSENMKKIIHATETGKGHLVMGLDNKSVSDYKRNKGGEITYGGLLSPIEKLESSAYDYDTFIPDKDILERNRTAITSNWMRENPTKGEPSEFDLLQYTKDNYSQKGTNTMSLQLKRQREAANRKRQEKEQKIFRSVAQGAQSEKESIEYNGPNKAKGFTGADPDEIRKRIKKFPTSILNTEDEWNISSETISHDGYAWDTKVSSKRGVGYKSAFEGKKDELAQTVFNGNFNEETKKYNFRKGNIHGANGEIFKAKDLDNLELIGMASLATGKGNLDLENREKDDEVFFLTEFADENGVRDKDKNKEYLDNVNTNGGSLVMREWMAFKDTDGKVYYKPLGEEQLVVQQVINEVIDANVDDIYKERQRENANIEYQKQQIKAETKQEKDNRRAIMNSPTYINNIEKNVLSPHEIPSKNIAIVQSLIQAFTDSKSDDIKTYEESNNKITSSIMGVVPPEVIEIMQQDEPDINKMMKKFLNISNEQYPSEQDRLQTKQITERWISNFKNLTGRDIK